MAVGRVNPNKLSPTMIHQRLRRAPDALEADRAKSLRPRPVVDPVLNRNAGEPMAGLVAGREGRESVPKVLKTFGMVNAPSSNMHGNCGRAARTAG